MAIDADQLGRLIDRHAAALELFARQWCDRPRDAVQEAFMKLITARKRPDRIVPWLYTVVRNCAISTSRSARRRRDREARAAGMRPKWFVPQDGAALDADAAVAALKTLPAEQRRVVVARIWGGLTFEEIGDVMDCGSSTAHRRYVCALETLREKLGIDHE